MNHAWRTVFLRVCFAESEIDGVSVGLMVWSGYPWLGRGTITTPASHQGEPGSIPDRVTVVFSQVGIVPAMPLVGRFSRGFPVSPAHSFRRRSIFTLITLIGSQELAVKSRPNLFTHSFSLYVYTGVYQLLATLGTKRSYRQPPKPLPPPPPANQTTPAGSAPFQTTRFFHHGVPGSITDGVTPGFSHLGIVPDDMFSFPRISLSARLMHSGAAPYLLRFTLISSQDRDVVSRPNLFTHLPTKKKLGGLENADE
ncbi:hypothetical protein PR048_021342 [Dryococelus australis]|uniref:Uncharacterized protein n=1 Tax=Dryococelus australis TaxID=614101 RepID=A0ABQ9GY33_9NEOP|nr:hypothetical protein PR048_021342 [Dryococelus australis]